ncbi:SRPBCC family protein [Gordonia sp. GONU]|uniref:SRPBCC family protein n=1 Tax=Gordonia sp. GONU TaxID=2972949 RepID=UPI0021ABB7CA|nr:SRPBCC family protein [Gordonia sp. GONU]MCR8897750.1 SRPBCC family protein [Gordonia sp. GONU]
MSTTQTRYPEAAIEADKEVPIIRITRDFRGTPAQLMKAHTDPDLFVRWIGPDAITSRILEWDVRDGGSWRYVSTHEGQEFGFRGCFHTVGEDKIVQTFTFLGMPDQVSLETLWFEDGGDGTTRLHAQSLCDSFEARDGWLASGMEVGVNEGYAALDGLLESGEL